MLVGFWFEEEEGAPFFECLVADESGFRVKMRAAARKRLMVVSFLPRSILLPRLLLLSCGGGHRISSGDEHVPEH